MDSTEIQPLSERHERAARARRFAQEATKISTGVEGLDRVLRGGLPEREIYLVQGEPGTGKTTLGLQFLLAGRARGETGLFITLTQRAADLERAAASHGWSLDGIHIHQLSRARGAGGRVDDQALFPTGDIELGEVMAEVLAVSERLRPARVVFDAIAELRLLANDSTRFQHQIFELRDLFADTGAAVVFLDTQAQSDGPRDMEHIAHGVILLDHTVTRFGNAQRRLQVVKMRGMGYSEGQHDFRIQAGGLVVFPRLLADAGDEGAEGVFESGVPGLDGLVGGGLAAGSSSLFVGPSGAGKSSVATLYACAAAARGQRAAAFLFEERPEMFLRRAESLGMAARNHVASGHLIARSVSTGELSPGEFAELVRCHVQERGVRVVVIDSLTGYISAMPDEQLLLTQMHDLLRYLSSQGVLTILVVAQHGIVGTTLVGPVDVSYLADAVLLFRHFETRGTLRRAISVFKKRYGDHEKLIRELRISPGGIEVGDPLHGYQGLLTGNPSSLEPDPGAGAHTPAAETRPR
ncbi:MAG TPA: ATPase domain-containing protein [Gemmatimonadaceae bacterium]|nr:ATPase domain-containing protein [Gemmatimonadaceae bacterium]